MITNTLTLRTAVALTLVVTCAVATSTLAHSTGGTVEATQDGYSVDIGYTPEFPIARNQVGFDFSIFSAEVSDPYTDVWVTIEKNNETFFSGNIFNPSFGPTGFTTILAEPGTYDISARFQNDGVLVTKFRFSIEVASSDTSVEIPSTEPTNYLLYLSILLLGGGIGGALVSGKNKIVAAQK